MLKPLPELIDPLQLADKGRVLQGRIAMSRFRRLAETLQDSDGHANVELRFDIDEHKQPYINGKVSLAAAMMCQRCLQPLVWNAEINVSLAIIKSELQAEKLSERYEPLLVSDEPMSLAEIVEDEILLAVPPAPVHTLSECPARDRNVAVQDVSSHRHTNSASSNIEDGIDRTQHTSGKKNPFLVLEVLKKNKKN